ncbi:MAG: histidine phosphatase family protein [Spirochaetes bacterium]|nr:histidine phosphatase family protein [Spirochaetota bacterium]
MRLYIIRHGDPDYKNDCLTEAGKREAAALGDFIHHYKIDRLYSSPCGRAQETARFIAAKTGHEIRTLQWTREIVELRDNVVKMMYWDAHGHDIRTDAYLRSPNDWSIAKPFAGVDMHAIVDPIYEAGDAFLATLGYEREDHVYRVRERNELGIAIACHGGFGLTWMAHLLAIPLPLMWAGFVMHTTSVSTIVFDERTPGIACPRLLGLGEIGHLHAAGVTPGRGGIKANYY